MPSKRPDREIVSDIVRTYNDLSPENLNCDGEISAAQARRKGKVLENKLADLFNEYGRPLSEEDAYDLHRNFQHGRGSGIGL